VNPFRLLAAGALLALGLAACGGAGSTIAGPPVAHAHSPTATAAPSSPQASATPPAPPPQPAGTQVITYAPWAAPGMLARGISAASTQSGSCFTTSSATTAPGAYRCFVGNNLYDPCFADATSGAGQAACPSPENPDSVIVIRLTAPLPKPATSPGSPIPWLLVLANGQHCQTITGTGGTLGGKNEAYGCAAGSVYGQINQGDATWTVSYAPSGAPASALTQEAVIKAYQ
jgi:hypothetical protein